MNIFVFTTAFAPSVGGIERVAAMLCREFVAQGHQVVLATTTPRGEHDDDALPYPVLRRPGLAAMMRALRACDVHLQANVALKYAWPRLAAPDRFVYQHNNVYQRDDGTLAPADRLKRAVARATPGIANSRYTARKLGSAYAIANPYDHGTFRAHAPWNERPGDLVFLGRLVSQKGADVLVRALGRLRGDGRAPSLTIIGDGPDRGELERLAGETGTHGQIRFTGALAGEALVRELNAHRIFVAPSSYEEPFGIVALEALACGCVPIVSERGGLVDAIGPHGVTFPNGDDAALAARLAEVLDRPAAAHARLDGVETHLAAHRADRVAARYVEVFEEIRQRR